MWTALYQGMTSVVPISPLFVNRRADFSPRGVARRVFSRSLLELLAFPRDVWGGVQGYNVLIVGGEGVS